MHMQQTIRGYEFFSVQPLRSLCLCG